MPNLRYKAAFLLPPETKRTLADDGWEFEFSNCLNQEIIEFLSKNLNLELTEKAEYSEIYRSNEVQMAVERNGERAVEYIYFQLFDLQTDPLVALWKTSVYRHLGEIFVP